MLRYKITSKLKPSLTIMEMTVIDGTFEESKKRQLLLLSHSMHPNVEMQNHLIKFGIRDFNFVPINFTDKPIEVIEKAIIVPEKEIRNNKRGRKKAAV